MLFVLALLEDSLPSFAAPPLTSAQSLSSTSATLRPNPSSPLNPSTPQPLASSLLRLEAAGHGPDAHHQPGSSEADAEFEWLSPNEETRIAFSRDWGVLLELAAQYDLCLTGVAR